MQNFHLHDEAHTFGGSSLVFLGDPEIINRDYKGAEMSMPISKYDTAFKYIMERLDLSRFKLEIYKDETSGDYIFTVFNLVTGETEWILHFILSTKHRIVMPVDICRFQHPKAENNSPGK